MKSVIAYFYLLLFTASTLTSFASVHACKGELTDIGIFSNAECGHSVQKIKQGHCHGDSCCKSKNEEGAANGDKSCCETGQLNPLKSDFITGNPFPQVNIVFFLPTPLYFINTVKQEYSSKISQLYPPPVVRRNLNVELQVFRI